MAINNFNADTPQLKLVENFLKGLTSLDINNTESSMSKGYKFKTFPTIADLPDEPKGGFFGKYGKVLSLVTKLEINIHEVIEAPGKVVLHVSGICDTVDGDKLDYDSLTIFTLVEEDGELKVDEHKDFCDPEKRGKLHHWVAKVAAKMVA